MAVTIPRLLLRGLLVALVVAAALSSMTPASGSGPGLWSQTGSMAKIRFGHTLTLLSDGRVLVTSGLGDPASRASAELYEPGSGTWSSAGSMATGRLNHTATLLVNGQVLVTGGTESWQSPVASAELYQPSTDLSDTSDLGTWVPTGSMLQARSGHTATLLANGKVLVAGGSDADGNWLASAELYDPAAAPPTSPWSSGGNMVETRSGHTATLLSDGRVLLTGAAYGRETALASAELYDPYTGEFTSAGSMAERRGGHTATLLSNGKVLVAGGLNNVKKGPRFKANYLASAELYDPVAQTWSPTSSMAEVHYLHTATATTLAPEDVRVLVAGGNCCIKAQEQTRRSCTIRLTKPGPPPAAFSLAQVIDSDKRIQHSRVSALLAVQRRVLVDQDGNGRDYRILASAEVYDPKRPPAPKPASSLAQ